MSSSLGAHADVITSSVALPHGTWHLKVDVVAKNPCSVHGIVDECPECLVGHHSNDFDLFTKQFAQFVQVYLLANLNTAVSASSVLNTSNSGQTIAAANAVGTIQIVAGTGTSAAAFTDYKLQTQSASTSGYVAAAMTAIASNTFTVTGTITNSSGSAIAYDEVGIYWTANSQIFCIAHDAPLSGGPYTVSNSGTMAVTYTATWT